MAVFPWSTSPILWVRPVKKRMRSLVVVFPESMWAMIPMLRILLLSIMAVRTYLKGGAV
jgi:hypothetical protein